MSSQYIGSVVQRDGKTATIRIYQTYPDSPLGTKTFIDESGAMAIAGWAFPESFAQKRFGITVQDDDAEYERFLEEDASTTLGTKIGAFEELFDCSAHDIAGLTLKKVEIVRSSYGKKNCAARLTAAGYAKNQELFHEVLMKICGVVDLHIEADEPSLLDPLVVGVEWEF